MSKAEEKAGGRVSLAELLAGVPDPPKGVVVHGRDGRSFFLPEADLPKFEIPGTPEFDAFRLATSQPGSAPKPEDYCGNLLNWMYSHGPTTTAWRKVSVMWINNC